MSTRCQIRVSAKGLVWDPEGGQDEVWIYHHCDGYPSSMLLEILKGYEAAIAPRVYCKGTKNEFVSEKAWEAGRPGKAAAYIIGVDPGGFEPQSKQDQDFHGDIKYFYEIILSNPNQGASGPKVPRWHVQVYTPVSGFWDNAKESHLKLRVQGDILALAKKAKTIEDRIRREDDAEYLKVEKLKANKA